MGSHPKRAGDGVEPENLKPEDSHVLTLEAGPEVSGRACGQHAQGHKFNLQLVLIWEERV